MARARARSNRGPSDQQILAAIRSTAAKRGYVYCIRYMVRTDLADALAADYLADAVTAQERSRFTNDAAMHTKGHAVDLASHPVLEEMSRCRVWTESRESVGVTFYRYWTDLTLTINERGVGTLLGDDTKKTWSMSSRSSR